MEHYKVKVCEHKPRMIEFSVVIPEANRLGWTVVGTISEDHSREIGRWMIENQCGRRASWDRWIMKNQAMATFALLYWNGRAAN